jgi:serine/threonine protein kinase
VKSQVVTNPSTMAYSARESRDRRDLSEDYAMIREVQNGQGDCNDGIYVVRHRTCRTLLVLKRVSNMDMAEDEREILSYFRGHPAVVGLVDAFVADPTSRRPTMNICLEYCDLGSLSSLIFWVRRYTPRPPCAAYLLVPIMRARIHALWNH